MPARQYASRDITLNGKPYRARGFTVDEFQPLSPQTHMGSPSYADRATESVSVQDDWSKGFGRGEIRDTKDEGRYHYAQNVDARFRSQLILGPLLSSTTFTTNAEAKVQFIEYNGTFYAIGARYVHSLSGTTWTVAQDMGATAAAVKGCATVFGGNLYVGAGASVDFWMYNGSAWSQPASGEKASQFTTSLGLSGQMLWKVSAGNQLKGSTDGVTWQTAISIGTSNDTATSLFDYNGFPHVGKPDGLFMYDGQTVWNVLSEFRFRKNASNCKGAAVGRNVVFLPVGPTVTAYSADLIVPDALASKPDRVQTTNARGTFIEFWPDADYMWGIMLSQAGDYYITAFDYSPEPGAGWHQVVKTGTTAVTALGIQQTSTPTLYYSEGTAVKYFLLPQNAVNPYVDTNYRYAASGSFFAAMETYNFDDVQKEFISEVTDTEGCDANKTVAIYYSIDGGAYTLLATRNTNGIAESFYPAGTTGRRKQLRYDFATNASTATPRLNPVASRYKRRFTPVRRWQFQVEAARYAGPNVPQAAKEQIANLMTARNTTAAVTLIDPNGSSYSVWVESVGQAEVGGESSNQMWLVPVTCSERRTS